METKNNNILKHGALFSLYVFSYLPLFFIVIIKQIHENWSYFHWGGLTMDGFMCFVSHFGMSFVLAVISALGIFGVIVLFENLETNLNNGQIVSVEKISNRNGESVAYIATYIVPFIAGDFSSLFECFIFIMIMILTIVR